MRSIHPCLIVRDVSATAAFYRERLGFEHADPAAAEGMLAGDFAMLTRGGVTLLFKAVPGGEPRPNHTVHAWAPHDGFIHVEDLDALHAELVEAGVRIVAAPHATDWGTRELHFQDPDGYVFCCGHRR